MTSRIGIKAEMKHQNVLLSCQIKNTQDSLPFAVGPKSGRAVSGAAACSQDLVASLRQLLSQVSTLADELYVSPLLVMLLTQKVTLGVPPALPLVVIVATPFEPATAVRPL